MSAWTGEQILELFPTCKMACEPFFNSFIFVILRGGWETGKEPRVVKKVLEYSIFGNFKGEIFKFPGL